MTINRSQTFQQSQQGRPIPISDLIDRLSRFDGPPEEFLVNLLAVQCAVSNATGGSILRTAADGRPEVLAVYPPLPKGGTAPVWLAQAVEALPQVAKAGAISVLPVRSGDELYGQPANRFLVMLPLRGGAGIRGMAAFLVETHSEAHLQHAQERLELTVSLLSLYEMRLTLQHRQFDLQRLRKAMEVVSAINEHDKFAGAGMTLCNELASRWEAHRVSLGFLKGQYVQLKALSHTEKFSRKMKLVQDIESAMEECLDQDVEVIYPPTAEDTSVSRAAGDLARSHGPSTVLSVPLRRAGEVIAVLTLERSSDRPFTLDEAEAIRLTGDLCTPRIVSLHEHDRWFGGRLALAARNNMAHVLGAKHTWIKAIVLGVLAAIVFLIFAKGNDYVEGTFTLQAIEKRIIPAPFAGVVESIEADFDHPVKAGTVLARMDTRDLQANLIKAQAEFTKNSVSAAQNRAAAMTDESKLADAQKDEAMAREAQANIDLYTKQINEAVIKAPFDGWVVQGEQRKYLHRPPVEMGEQLFELVALDSLRAEASIPENRISDVTVGMSGELATTGAPEKHIPFIVERIHPVAEVSEQQNVFKIRLELKDLKKAEDGGELRPGMEGIAKVNAGRSHYAWIWTRSMVNWVRMKLWI